MINIYVLTQNVKLESLEKYKCQSTDDTNVFLSTNFMFENERDYLSRFFCNTVFKTFADYLTDDEMAEIDVNSYTEGIRQDAYISEIKRRKNLLVLKKVLIEYPDCRKMVFSRNLGVDIRVWKKAGFKHCIVEYYDNENIPLKQQIRQLLSRNNTIRNVYHCFIGTKASRITYTKEDVKVAYYGDKKYVFLGNLNRIAYRLDIKLDSPSYEVDNLNRGEYEPKDKCTYVTTWHEHFKYYNIPDNSDIAVRWAQDGYLPPNYTHFDYEFKPDNVVYYCWDKLGTQLFINRQLPYEVIPYRKKLYLPTPSFPTKVKNILIVASGSGDWTALKNRSDDDILVYAFAQMAKRFPDIHFTYRCHPTWIHPSNVGVNAISRVNDYFESLELPNLTLSSNTPLANKKEGFQLSFSRSSLDEDLKSSDFVFGEHSISMIDAAFQGIPFCSVNLTNRRNFFVGINDLGFPTVSSHDDIAKIIDNISSEEFKSKYLLAVEKYNKMTDEE